MAIFRYALHSPMPSPCRFGALTIGNFDGVHRGHQALLQETARQAQGLKGPASAVTLDPHPSHWLRPGQNQPLLTSIDERVALLQASGIEHVLILQTTEELLQLSARAFFEEILVEGLQVRALVEGYNFGFGKGREGTTEVLKGLCAKHQVPLTLLPPCEVLGLPVSSSRVRSELLSGEIENVSRLLGRPYRLHGIVERGKQRGSQLGFPTANLHQVTSLIPENGVYAVLATHEARIWRAAAHIGPNPTFGEATRKIEVHLLGFSGDLYHQPLAIDFIARIRGVKSFDNVQELAAQIQMDLAAVHEILKGV